MCLIIHKPNANSEIPEHYIDNAETINPDGFGIVFTDTNECIRTMDYNYARELVLVERPFVAHYRYATRGTINKDNCHPYHIKQFSRLFSNGTVGNLGDKQLCDTAVVAGYLKWTPKKHWADMLSMTETRFAITHADGTVERHGDWHEKNGVFYSKNNCFYTKRSAIGYHYGNQYANSAWDDGWDDIDNYGIQNTLTTTSDWDWQGINRIAVYGTLKAGNHNHGLVSKGSYIGAGLTINKYAMQDHGVPYVFKHRSRDQINVEVYEVPDYNQRLQIDSLEGHPDHYQRELIDVELLDGSTQTCWLYFGHPTLHDPNVKYISNY